MNNRQNNKEGKLSPKKKLNNYNLYQKELISYIKSIQNILNKKTTIINQKSIIKEINQILTEISLLFEKLINEKEEMNIKKYESLLKREENKIRILYGDLLHEKLLKEILEEKIILLLQTQTEYELVKEKTGVIVSDGKVICNERKDNEIIILRTENSTLKNVIDEKDKKINLLNEKIKILNKENIKLKKCKTNINININDINNPPSISKKNSKFITINRAKEKNLLFNTIYSPGYSSQKEITINNFSSSTKNFYKTYHMHTKIINHISTNKKSLEKSGEKTNKNINININSQDNTIFPQEKLISVNKNNYNKKNSRNKIPNKNYSSCESILNGNNNKFKIKLNNDNSGTKKSKEKKIERQKLFSPLQEYNSIKYVNNKLNNKKEGYSYIPKSTRDSNLNINLKKQNTNILFSSKLQKSNKKNDKNNKKSKGPKTGSLKRKKIPIFRNENTTKNDINDFFQLTYNENFKDKNKNIK